MGSRRHSTTAASSMISCSTPSTAPGSRSCEASRADIHQKFRSCCSHAKRMRLKNMQNIYRVNVFVKILHIIQCFRCHKGTIFEGESTHSICKANGNWSHPTPQCMGKSHSTGEARNFDTRRINIEFYIIHTLLPSSIIDKQFTIS